MNQNQISLDIQKEVKQIVSRFNKETINNPKTFYMPRFKGQYLYLDRCSNNREEPVCRLKHNGKMNNWDFAIFKWSSEKYSDDELFIVPGNKHIDGTIEGAMKCGMEAYPV